MWSKGRGGTEEPSRDILFGDGASAAFGGDEGDVVVLLL